MKLGIMGGTFNPPHIGHLEAARNVYHALGLDQVLFIPTNEPPHKQMPRRSATPEQRFEMVQCMVQGEPWAQVSAIELARGGASYTVDTLRRLQHSADKMALIVGTDMLLSFEKWYQPEEICRLAALAVVARDERDAQTLENQAQKLRSAFDADITLVQCPSIPVSSTEVRAGQLDAAALPAAVADYIRENQLYRF